MSAPAPLTATELLAAPDASLTARELRSRNAIRTLLSRLDAAERTIGDRADIRNARARVMALASDDDRRAVRAMVTAITGEARDARNVSAWRETRADQIDAMAAHRARLGIRDHVDMGDARTVVNLIDRHALDIDDPAVTCAAIDALIMACTAAYRADARGDARDVPWSVWTLGARWSARIAAASLMGAGHPADQCPNRHYRSRGSVPADRVRVASPATDPGLAIMANGQTNASHLCANRASAAFGAL